MGGASLSNAVPEDGASSLAGVGESVRSADSMARLDGAAAPANELAVRRRESIQLFESVVASLSEAPERLPTLEPDMLRSSVLSGSRS